jgi:hypothetical protein
VVPATTLCCECGGAIEIVDASFGEDHAVGIDECPSCGRSGSDSFGGGESTSGCVVSDRQVEP